MVIYADQMCARLVHVCVSDCILVIALYDRYSVGSSQERKAGA